MVVIILQVYLGQAVLVRGYSLVGLRYVNPEQFCLSLALVWGELALPQRKWEPARI